MNTGTGIFLGAILLSMVLLFNFTKDRWNWAKIVKVVAAILLSIVIAVGIIEFTKNNQNNKVSVVDSYGSISIGMSFNEVKYIKGIPDRVAKFKNDKDADFSMLIDINRMPEKHTENDYRIWQYEGSISVYFDSKGTVNGISCSKKTLYCPSVFGIGIYDSERSIIDLLGEPEESNLSSDGNKYLSYKKLNVLFVLNKQAVSEIVVMNIE